MTNNILEVHNILGNNRKMYLIGEPTVPNYNVYNCLSGIQLIGNQLLSSGCSVTSPIYQKSFNHVLQNIADSHKNIFYLDPNNALCANGQCTVIINNEPIYSDASHLSIYGSELIGKFLFNLIGVEEYNE